MEQRQLQPLSQVARAARLEHTALALLSMHVQQEDIALLDQSEVSYESQVLIMKILQDCLLPLNARLVVKTYTVLRVSMDLVTVKLDISAIQDLILHYRLVLMELMITINAQLVTIA